MHLIGVMIQNTILHSYHGILFSHHKDQITKKNLLSIYFDKAEFKKITDEQTGVIEIVIASNTNCIYKASKKAFFFSVIISHCQFPCDFFKTSHTHLIS